MLGEAVATIILREVIALIIWGRVIFVIVLGQALREIPGAIGRALCKISVCVIIRQKIRAEVKIREDDTAVKGLRL